MKYLPRPLTFPTLALLILTHQSLIACTSNDRANPNQYADLIADDESALWGNQTEWAYDSRGEDLTSAQGVAGAVAYLSNGFSGVLLRRDRVLTSARAITGGQISVTFAQEPGEVFDVVGHAKHPKSSQFGRELAFVFLDRDVPPSIVQKLPKVQMHNIKDHLKKKVLKYSPPCSQ